MADVKPNYELERKRIELEISQQRLSILSQQYRIAQLLDEKDRIEENIIATEKSATELEDQLNKLSRSK